MKIGREDFGPWMDHCDRLLREGQTPAAIKSLKKIPAVRIPRPHVVRYCSLVRRANIPEFSLEVLKRYVYPKIKTAVPAAPGELLEYALALQRVGANRESRHVAGLVDPAQEPRAWLVRASQCVSEWDYAAALPMYETVLADKWLKDYELLVCRVNHLACLAQTGDSRFEKAFNGLKQDLNVEKHSRLLGNILEVCAQRQIQDKNWAEARATLRDADRLLAREESYGRLFVKKWTAIASAMESGERKPLDELRALALEGRDWETLRHVDYFRTAMDPDGPWANWVYFGTPYASFRMMVARSRDFPDEAWVVREGAGTRPVDPWFVNSDNGEICHRLLVLLLRDFYRPAQVGEVASELFETKIFDLDLSKKRTHKLMQRFRNWLKEHALPFRLDTADGYSLRWTGPVSLKCRRHTLPMGKGGFIFGRFAQGTNPDLSLVEWAQQLNISHSRAQLLIASAVEAGVLERKGAGRYSTYQFIVAVSLGEK